MPIDLPAAEPSHGVVRSSDLESGAILCGAGAPDLVYAVLPRRLVEALQGRGSVATIHAEGVGPEGAVAAK
jgi:hypothetical protein